MRGGCGAARRGTWGRARWRGWLGGARGGRVLRGRLALGVGLACADTSRVRLGLPELYVELDARSRGVSMVATAYNLVVAAAAFALC